MQSPEFQPIKEAAERLGLNVGHVRKLCAQQLAAKGLAELRKIEGQRASWFVSPEYRTGEKPRQGFPVKLTLNCDDLLLLPTRQRLAVADRAGIVRQFHESLRAADLAGKSHQQATREFLKQLMARERRRLSKSTLWNWDRKLRQDGFSGLIDHRSAREPSPAGAGGSPVTPGATQDITVTIRIHAPGPLKLETVRSESKPI